MRLIYRFLVLATLAVGATRCTAQEITVMAAKPGGIYAVGEKIVWRIGVQGDGAAGIDKVSYVLKQGALTEMGRGELSIKDGGGELATQLGEPGSVLVELSATPLG